MSRTTNPEYVSNRQVQLRCVEETKEQMSDYHVAVHEAGHAVIGRGLGLVSGGASIIENEYSRGRSEIYHPNVTRGAWDEQGKCRHPRLAVHGAILATMAGEEAETVILGTVNL